MALSVALASETRTTLENCNSCLSQNQGVTCINQEFTYGVCCDYADSNAQQACMNKYKFCSTNLPDSYLMMTCPPQNCPEDNKGFEFKASVLNRLYTDELNIGWDWSSRINCRVRFHADESLNGMLVVTIESSDPSLYIYKQPNSFNTEQTGTHGLVDNGLLQGNKKRGTIEVPSDWSIYLQYNSARMGGDIKFTYEVREYTQDDIYRIENVMQPTGTKWVNQTEEALKKKEEEERIKREREELLRIQEEQERQLKIAELER